MSLEVCDFDYFVATRHSLTLGLSHRLLPAEPPYRHWLGELGLVRGTAVSDYYSAELLFTDRRSRSSSELAELLGQVKPPVATKEEIEKSGLQIIKPSDLQQYEKDGRVASNCVDRVCPSPLPLSLPVTDHHIHARSA